MSANSPHFIRRSKVFSRRSTRASALRKYTTCNNFGTHGDITIEDENPVRRKYFQRKWQQRFQDYDFLPKSKPNLRQVCRVEVRFLLFNSIKCK